MNDSELKIGGLWLVSRTVEIPGQGRIDQGTYGIITKVEYAPHVRRDGIKVDRWNISFLASEKLLEIRRVSEHVWKFYFRSIETECL